MPDRVTKEPGIPDDIMHIADAIAADLPIGPLRQGFAANVIARAILAERVRAIEAATEALDAADYYIDRLWTAYSGKRVRDMDEASAAYYRLAGVVRVKLSSLAGDGPGDPTKQAG